jgi:HK97 family phage portal protein
MRLFGFEISRAARRKAATLSSVDSRGGWWPLVYESRAGSWQSDVQLSVDQAYGYHVVWACATLIAGDIGKLGLNLMRRAGRVWEETDNPAYSPVLRKPNHFQTRQKFVESWIFSKLLRGNAYILKQRDARNVVTALYPLHPDRVHPLVAPNGDVFYQIMRDDLARNSRDIAAAPASEIIHDPMYTLFHPLVGVSPLYACALAASQGLAIQRNGSKFFSNAAQPGGILTAPGQISDETAVRLKSQWEANYSGDKVGRVAVLGDGLKFESMTMTALDAQLVQQAEMSDKAICSAFHVPGHKVGVGALPAHDNIEALDQQYYSQCLQTLIESFEVHLDEGLALGRDYRSEFDLDGLLRMDTSRKVEAAEKLVGAGILAPDEARQKFNLGPVEGGASPMMQQQNYSLAALAERDRNNPLAAPPAPAAPPPAGEDEDADEEEDAVELAASRVGLQLKALDLDTLMAA